MPTKKYQLLEHTADIYVRIYGKTLKELFRNAAAALFDIIAKKKHGKAPKPKVLNMKLSAENPEELLISWLAELLSLSEAKDLIFNKFKIVSLTNNKIEATVSGVKRENFLIKTEIKAATYHELKIDKVKNGYEAEVIFDV